MSLTVDAIRAASSDDQLFNLLSETIAEYFPPELQENREQFLMTLQKAPRGIRAMAGIYDLDVSLSMDDLAWHFGNHNDERFLSETADGLNELEAVEAAEIFRSAWEVVKPHLTEIRSKDWEMEDFQDYLDKSGIQSKTDPLNDRIWAITKELGDLGLLQYWLKYARRHPERCVKSD